MYGLVIEREGNIVKSTKTCNVSVQVDGSKTILFYAYGVNVIRQDELNTWLNVDYEDIDSVMFCLIRE